MFGFSKNPGNAAATDGMSREIERAAMRVATGNLNENDRYVLNCKNNTGSMQTPGWSWQRK